MCCVGRYLRGHRWYRLSFVTLLDFWSWVRDWRGLVGTKVRPLFVHEPDHMGERRKVAQLDFVVTGDAVCFTDRSHHFRLLYGIDPQIRFKIEIQIEHVHRIASLLSNQRQDSFLYRITLRSGHRSVWLRGRRRLRLRSRFGDRAGWGHLLYVDRGSRGL